MRAIHSHRAHSATSQGVYLSGRRTPGGTSRARRLLATNTALLTSAHRMISPPSHKRKPCTLPTHPPLHNPTKPKTAASTQKGTHTTRSLALSPNTPNTKPSLALLSSAPALGRFLSLAPLRPTPRRGALRPVLTPPSPPPTARRRRQRTKKRQAKDGSPSSRREPPSPQRHQPTPPPLSTPTCHTQPRTHAHTHPQAASLRSEEGGGVGAEEEEGTASTHLHARTHTYAPPLSPGHRAQETQGGPAAATDDDARGPPHKRARGTSHEPSSRAKTQPRAEQPSLDARATCSSSQCRGARTRHASTPTRARPLPLWPRTRRQARRRTRWQGAGKARTHAPRAHARASRLSDLHAQSSVPLRPARAPRSRTCAHAHRAHAHTRRCGTVSIRRGRCLAGAGGAALPAAWKRSA